MPPRPHDDPFLPPAWPDWVNDPRDPRWTVPEPSTPEDEEVE